MLGRKSRRHADRGPLLGSLDRLTLPLLVGHLTKHTTTPEMCWSALWVGFGNSPEAWRAKPAFRLPGPQYWLSISTLADVVRLSSEFETDGESERWRTALRGTGIVHSPTVWWPDDRSWLVNSEVDHDSTVVGGTSSLIQALVDDTEIEALLIDREVSLYVNGDTTNGGSYPSGWPGQD